MKITRKDLRKLINEAMTSGSSSNIRLKDLDIALAIAIIDDKMEDVDSDLREYTHQYRDAIKIQLEELKELCESGDLDIIGKLYMMKQAADANGDRYINDTIEKIFDDATEVG